MAQPRLNIRSTKVQLIYGIAGVTFATIVKGIVIAHDMDAIIKLLGAIVPIFWGILGTYLIDRGKDAAKDVAMARNGVGQKDPVPAPAPTG